MKEIDFLRPSFKAAIYEAKEVWEKKGEPSNFIEFVQVREQSGEDLMLHKAVWSKNNTSIICQLCSDAFSLTNRRHHCRACGVLCCDRCSTKRLHLAGENGSTILISNNNNPTVNTNNNNTGGGRDSWKLVGGGSDRKSFSTTVSGGSNKESLFVLEINTQPGMTKLSLVPEISAYTGINFINLIELILKDASINK